MRRWRPATSYNAVEDTPLTVAAPGVLGNDTDVDGNPLTAAVVTVPTHGTLTLNADGSFTYTPALNYNGSDSFTYKANDGTADSNTATVTITVGAANDAPVATGRQLQRDGGHAADGRGAGVLGNDTDVDGNPLTAAVVTLPTHGTLALNAGRQLHLHAGAELQRQRQLHLQGERRDGGFEHGDGDDHGRRGERRARRDRRQLQRRRRTRR